MEPVTYEQFLEVYSQFVSMPKVKIEMLLTQADLKTPPTIWLDKYRFGCMLITAHWLTLEMQQMSQLAGMAAQTTGGSSVSISSIQGDELDLTIFGKQYMALRATLPISGFAF